MTCFSDIIYHQVPHIRYATPERLLERLTDLRFLSIDFLNTFLLTYRVFCDGVTVLEALKKVYTNPDVPDQGNDSRDSSVERYDGFCEFIMLTLLPFSICDYISLQDGKHVLREKWNFNISKYTPSLTLSDI